MRGARRLSYVQRWGIVPKLRPQSVAEHSYYVALYTMKICDILGLDHAVRFAALQYALTHDMAEAFTGDIPTPLKKRISNFTQAEVDIKEWMKVEVTNSNDHIIKPIVKIADILDAVVWLTEEKSMGNIRLDKLRSQMNKTLVHETDKLSSRYEMDGVEEFLDVTIAEAKKGITWYAE